MNWILLIAMLSPGGDYMDKVPVLMPNKAACEAALKALPKRGEDPMGVQFQGKCVTRDHWLGKKQMPGVAYD